MGRDKLVDEIAQAMARAENASEDHFEAYRHVAEAVAAVVEPLLAEKDKALTEAVEVLGEVQRFIPYEKPEKGPLPQWIVEIRERVVAILDPSPVSLDEPAGSVEEQGPGRLVAACSHCDGHGLMQTGYTGTLQYCGECNACDGSGTVPVVTDEEMAALRSACSKCGGVVSLEAVCGSCGDMPAGSLTENEGRKLLDDGEPMRALLTANRNAAAMHGFVPFSLLRAAATHTGAMLLRELDALGWQLVPTDEAASRFPLDGFRASRPVRVEEQGESEA